MADIKINERIYYRVDPLLCQLLDELHPGKIERLAARPHHENDPVRQAPIAPAKNHWRVVVGDSQGRVTLVANLTRGEEVRFDGVIGSPQYKSFVAYCGEAPPQSILAAYAEAR